MHRESFFGRLWRVLGLLGKGKWPYVFALSTCAVIEPIYQIAFALVNRRIMNSIEFGDIGLLYSSLTLLAAVLVFHFTMQPLTAYHYEGRLYIPIIDFKLRLLRHITRVPLAWLDSRHSGDLMTRVSQDVEDLDDLFRMHTYDLLSSIIWGVGSIVSMFIINPYMAGIMIGLGILTAWGNTAFSQRLADETRGEREALSRTNQKLTDIIPGLRVIKSFNLEAQFSQDFAGESKEWAGHSLNKSGTVAKRASSSFMLSTLSFLGGLVIAAFLVANGILDLGSALAVILLQNGVTAMFSQTGKYYAQVKASMVGVKRIFEILDQPEEEGSFNAPLRRNDEQTAVLFQDVSFYYPNGKAVLNGLNLSVAKGQTTALAGASGGGKSTIVKLLLGLYIPQQGRIYVNGVDISSLSLEELRDQIAYVSQDVFLFSDTIIENIRLGRTDATDSEVMAAAKSAWAHGFIMDLPRGYETKIGEGGDGLSGGQRQRIAIARAILKNAPILVLDEATSALDSESEQELYKALVGLIQGKTVLTVAHRESSVSWAQTVHVIDSVGDETA